MNIIGEIFTNEDIKNCDLIAKEYLDLDENTLSLNRQSLKEIYSCYYSEPDEDGNALIVCKDGSFLHANKLISLELHIEAFKRGIRSSKKVLTNK